jgi:hypothetical protein
MRLKIIKAPKVECIDGIQLDTFVPGFEYEVGTTIGTYLLAEGWAKPADRTESGPLISGGNWSLPRTLTHEKRPYLAADSSKRKRRR